MNRREKARLRQLLIMLIENIDAELTPTGPENEREEVAPTGSCRQRDC